MDFTRLSRFHLSKWLQASWYTKKSFLFSGTAITCECQTIETISQDTFSNVRHYILPNKYVLKRTRNA